MRTLIALVLVAAGLIAGKYFVTQHTDKIQLEVAADAGKTIQEQAFEQGFDASEIQYKVSGRKVTLTTDEEAEIIAAQRDALIAALEAQPSISKVKTNDFYTATPGEEINTDVFAMPTFAPIEFPKRVVELEPAAGPSGSGCLQLNANLADATIRFDSTATYIYRKYRGALLDLVKDLNSCSGEYNLAIDGHTDFTASESYNQQLSLQRAQRVAAFLKDQGVRIALRTNGFGDTKPVANNRKVAGRALNRRVELTLVPLR